MNKIKTIYFVFLLIFLLVFGIIIIIPEVIPSLETIQGITIGVIYLVNIILAYILIVRLRNYLLTIFDKKRTLILSSIVGGILVIILLCLFVINSLGIGQGFMGGEFYKKLIFPQHHVTLYIYDDGFLDPLTSVKIENKTFPVMKNYFYIENCSPYELKTWKHDDIVEFTSKDIIVKINLKTRTVEKNYLKKDN